MTRRGECGRGVRTLANESRTFTVLDDYARSKHQCFVAEMSLDKSGTEYVLCFRPTGASNDSSNRFACRYVTIQAALVDSIAETGTIQTSVADKLNSELLALRESM